MLKFRGRAPRLDTGTLSTDDTLVPMSPIFSAKHVPHGMLRSVHRLAEKKRVYATVAVMCVAADYRSWKQLCLFEYEGSEDGVHSVVVSEDFYIGDIVVSIDDDRSGFRFDSLREPGFWVVVRHTDLM